ncbi:MULTISPECIES: hypothetical protein [unclassified Chitinophaga]|uniref:hypothetical protein n=1 Tax=unclassified Chitinophaga TaxID=2619133 RepID=UPI0009D542FF|nr:MULTISPECIES: hypothetical protein [unclassified Chitinophaga]OMP75975.1 hypothetical protein BW716_27565 [[Flexibacter] sp. ATCC 35208]WPV64300.1 hypothetical protein QQL36_21095 [Chitinophaga sp. LS1]
MNAVGFLQIHDPHIACSRKINSLFSDSLLDKEKLFEICNYLESGVSIVRYISNLYDEDGELIGPNIIYTDGLWIWPSYYSFYLKKYPQILIPDDLQFHIGLNAGKIFIISKGEKRYIEYITSKMLGLKLPDNYTLSNDIINIIIERGDTITCY